MAWVAAAMLGGSLLSYSGAKKQAAADERTAAANRAAHEASEKANWDRYLFTRGVDPNNGNRAVNAKLPLWANVDVTRPSASVFRLVPAGSKAPATAMRGLTRTAAPVAGGTQFPAGAGSSGGGGPAAQPQLSWMPPGTPGIPIIEAY
ncbi:MAG: hypothetical protein KIT44_07950 [Opitutaceae bacterium]|nr:hypothetical protein [Opitutaceae bacterium]